MCNSKLLIGGVITVSASYLSAQLHMCQNWLIVCNQYYYNNRSGTVFGKLFQNPLFVGFEITY